MTLSLLGIFAGVAGILPVVSATDIPQKTRTSAQKTDKKNNIQKNTRKKASTKTSRAGKTRSAPPLNWQKQEPFKNDNTIKKSEFGTQTASSTPKKITCNNISSSCQCLVNCWHHVLLTFHPASAILDGYQNPVMIFSSKKTVYDKNTLEHMASTRKSSGYAIGSARFSMNYAKAHDKSKEKISRFLSGQDVPDINNNEIIESMSNQTNMQLGMEYATDNGRINASVNYVKLKDLKNNNTGNSTQNGNLADSPDLKTITIGYTYDMSPRTSLYGMVAHTEYEKEAIANYMRNSHFNEDSVTGVQFGMTHRF